MTAPVDAADPLKLAELFHGGEAWRPILQGIIEAQPDAARFIGPARSRAIVPVRELTFQALKPNPPEAWRIVAFGQNPYPRVESATGIAMFDNAFASWDDRRFEYVASMQNILKAALIWRHGVSPNLDVPALRRLLREYDVVGPREWFQAMLAQGVLLLNASLTASSDGKVPLEAHTAFWRPVVEGVVDAILAAKVNADKRHRGVVFAWWGNHARALRPMVESIARRHPSVPIRHVDHWNPAARDDRFYRGNHFKDLNAALLAVGGERVAWLPTPGWQQRLFGTAPEQSARMGGFIQETVDLHRLYLERLADARDESLAELADIRGVAALPRVSFAEALAPVASADPSLRERLHHVNTWASNTSATTLTRDQAAAIHLYTMGSSFYRLLNAALRDPDRAKVAPYLPYLRLLLEAIDALPRHTAPLWRGVALDLRAQYPVGASVTWWGVSSCSTQRTVAEGFAGAGTVRTLFQVVARRAVSIRAWSAFTAEEEVILAPGTPLRVRHARELSKGVHEVTLVEREEPRRLS